MMDSSHHQTTIHTLAALTRGAAGANSNNQTQTQSQSNKQHPMQHQFHHTLQHQQPLVNTNSQNHQLLQFHHSPGQQQQQHHPYSTLSTLHHHQAANNSNQSHLNLLSQLQHLNNGGASDHGLAGLFGNQTLHHPTSSQNSASSQATTIGHQQQLQHYFSSTPTPSQLQHKLLLNQTSSQNSNSSSGGQHQHQLSQHQLQQQQAYNMNSSDYSSSTYHVYDQILGDQIIDDLIVIKQERMKKKLEQEHRRKVILFSLAVILLVGLLMFLIVQLFKATSTASLPATIMANQVSQQQANSISLARIEQNNNNNNNNNDMQKTNDNYRDPSRTHWAPPGVGQADEKQWPYVPGRFMPRPPMAPQLQPISSYNPMIISVNQQPQQPSVPILMPSPSLSQTTTQQPNILPPATQPLPPSQVQQPAPTTPPPPPPAPIVVPSPTRPSDTNNIRGCIGKHCNPTTGCPNQCSGRGQCVKVAPVGQPDNLWLFQHQAQPLAPMQQEWRCQCPAGSTGDDCGILMERQCDDGIDNDKDGLVDCADSECCSDLVCQNSTLCMKSPDPLDILMRKPPLPPTSSFFQRMQFLIEKFSSQIYSNIKDFNDSRASVIRGRVTYQKQGVTGVRVSIVGQTNLGITLSRDGGYFDLMVNGGGAIVLEFKREPFATLEKTIRVPWNEIVLVDSIELQLVAPTTSQQQDQSNSRQQISTKALLPEPETPTCSAHNYRLMRPLIMAAPRSSRHSQQHQSASLSRHHQQQQHSTTSVNKQAPRTVTSRDSTSLVQQSIVLPQSASSQQYNDSVSIVYISSKAKEFMSTISIQLIPPTTLEQQQENLKIINDELKQVHLKIVIEGILFEQSFEPQLNLSFTYAWNRQNVYRQKSFGLSTASVSVGYEYVDCKQVIWSTKRVELAGHDLSISDINSQWNLNVHHRYNYRDSILQRGDGQNFYLKTDKPLIVQPVMGDGYPRQANCPFCDGATSPSEQKLLRPQALVAAPDGSLYVGDFNMIRRIEPAQSSQSGHPTSVSPNTMSGSMAPGKGFERAVRTVLELVPDRVPTDYSLALNLAPSDTSQAGLYLVDTSHHQVFMIREQRPTTNGNNNADSTNETTPPSSSVSLAHQDDILVPVVGTGDKCQPDDRSSCGDGHAAQLAKLIEPRAAVFDLAGRLYIADGPNVRMVDLDQKIYTILGDYSSPSARHHHHHAKFPCSGEAIAMHKFLPRAPQDVAFNPIDETLHILDDNVVYKITQDKRVQVVAGKPAHCVTGNSQRSSQRATESILQSARSITFNQNGEMFIGEDDVGQSTGRVLLVSPEDDTISLYAGQSSEAVAPQLDSRDSTVDQSYQQQQQQQQQESQLLGSTKLRSSNVLPPMGQATRASEHKFSSVASLAVDQRGNLLVADKLQLRVVSIEPDLPQMNSVGEYEIQSPENQDELLIFNRHGLHMATRELTSGTGANLAPGLTRNAINKYTFAYNVNTSYGQLASMTYANGNKISIYRDGPHHSVKMIETASGGSQCKFRQRSLEFEVRELRIAVQECRDGLPDLARWKEN